VDNPALVPELSPVLRTGHRGGKNPVKMPFTAQWISTYSYLIDSNLAFCATRHSAFPRARHPPVLTGPDRSDRRAEPVLPFLPPARRVTADFPCARIVEGPWSWGSGYSLIALYINSSSNRVTPFLWTSAFS
jgi:hypothetical protein